MGVHSLGWEDPLEKGMATHSSILGWRIPWTEEPGGVMGSQSVRHDWATSGNTWNMEVYLKIFEEEEKDWLVTIVTV